MLKETYSLADQLLFLAGFLVKLKIKTNLIQYTKGSNYVFGDKNFQTSQTI